MGKDKNGQINEASGKKKKKIIITIVVIAAAAAVAFAGWHAHQKKQIESIMPTVTTDQVSRKTLTSSIAATGTIKSKVVTDVTAGGVGETGLKVTGVNVKVGDVVSEGDVLCTFDVSSAKEQLADVKEAQAKAEAAEAQGIKSAQRAYDQAVSSKDTSLERAQNAIDEAAAKRDSLYAARDSLKSEIEEAEKAVAEAEAALQSAPEDEKAKKSLEDAKAYLSELEDENKSMPENISAAESALQEAVYGYEDAEKAADEAIASAKDALDSANLGADGEDNSTKAQIRSLQEAIDGESLKSPVSGTVTAVNVAADGIYTGGIVVTIQDTEHLYVEASIKETDIPDVKEGMDVLIKTDATGDEELAGKVTSVAPTAGSESVPAANAMEGLGNTAVSSSGSGYQVEIDLLEANERLRIDMTAKLSLIKEQKKNILVVPYDAIFTDENGNKTLHVVPDAQSDGTSAVPEMTGAESADDYTEIKVETGMESGYYVEILPTPGIENGTVILLPQTGTEGLDEMDPAGGLG